MHHDKAGNPLEIGTKVLYLKPYYHQLGWGVVFAHTPKKVRMENGDLAYPSECVVPKEN
jgi:hypothetical protein